MNDLILKLNVYIGGRTFICHLICLQTSESAFVKRSAASMLSGKRPVQSAVRLYLAIYLIFDDIIIVFLMNAS